MNEKEIQIKKYEDRYSFREVNRREFNQHVLSLRKNYKLINSDEVVYYRISPSGRIVGKADSANRKFYLT